MISANFLILHLQKILKPRSCCKKKHLLFSPQVLSPKPPVPLHLKKVKVGTSSSGWWLRIGQQRSLVKNQRRETRLWKVCFLKGKSKHKYIAWYVRKTCIYINDILILSVTVYLSQNDIIVCSFEFNITYSGSIPNFSHQP